MSKFYGIIDGFTVYRYCHGFTDIITVKGLTKDTDVSFLLFVMIHLFPVISVSLVRRSASIVILVFSFVILVFVTTRLSHLPYSSDSSKVPYYHVCVQMNGYLKNGVCNDSVINCLFYLLVCCKESCDYNYKVS